ncbi:sn-glycerol-3-phosphate ABC transporter ATP-binding protein UgpC [soil metagenome]
MSRIRLEKIAKRYGTVEVLRDIDLIAEDGEFVVLVGPSGCGKSTLLRMIAGLEDITAGDLYIGERRANDLPPQKRNISMVFQSYALFPHMTARDNIGFGPRIRGEPAASTAEKVGRAAQILNLHAYLDRLPRQLSGGQRQRIAMGRTIVRDPDVFLFDEPLSNLDAKLRVQMRAEIKSLHHKLGTTIVYVTHDQIEAMTMADRIVVMNDGRIEQVGKPLELYDRPANKFVAGFLGSPAMNFIRGTVREGTVQTVGGHRIAIGDSPALAGRSVWAGIRPEHCHLATAGLPLIVDVVEPTGAETHVSGMIGGDPVRCVFRERLEAEPGSIIHLTIPPAQTHVFDGDTGARLSP